MEGVDRDSRYRRQGKIWLASAPREIGELRTWIAPAVAEAEWRERRSGAVKID